MRHPTARLLTAAATFLFLTSLGAAETYTVVDTGQTQSYDNDGNVISPSPGDPFYGQDAQYDGAQFSFVDNGDGTVAACCPNSWLIRCHVAGRIARKHRFS